jgi:hypothetical protein
MSLHTQRSECESLDSCLPPKLRKFLDLELVRIRSFYLKQETRGSCFLGIVSYFGTSFLSFEHRTLSNSKPTV